MRFKRKAASLASGANGNSLYTPSLHKDTHNLPQLQTLRLSFSVRPKTMLEVSQETGILRANICRYVGKMRKRDQIAVVRHGLCPITKFRAGFYTTDPALFGKEGYDG